jgi:hypothetical protein
LGQRAQNGLGYQFPPLWGPDSYNNGAGMSRLLTAAAYALHNMPLGTRFDAPVLTDEQAYDVAGHIVSQNRPEKANLDKDFPIRLVWDFLCQGCITPFLSCFVASFFCSTRAASILPSRPHIAVAVARSGGQGRRFFSAAEGLSLTDASTAAGCP